MTKQPAIASLFLVPEAYVAYYLDTAAYFRRAAQAHPNARRYWIGVARENVTYARRMRLEAF